VGIPSGLSVLGVGWREDSGKNRSGMDARMRENSAKFWRGLLLDEADSLRLVGTWEHEMGVGLGGRWMGFRKFLAVLEAPAWWERVGSELIFSLGCVGLERKSFVV
jgi:hypothetical protein